MLIASLTRSLGRHGLDARPARSVGVKLLDGAEQVDAVVAADAVDHLVGHNEPRALAPHAHVRQQAPAVDRRVVPLHGRVARRAVKPAAYVYHVCHSTRDSYHRTAKPGVNCLFLVVTDQEVIQANCRLATCLCATN